uniref:Uncharacterized protein n=1 Tax=Leptocylindrus danicus TaxID=163516 RepID=A0A7S2K3Q9_9STRA
MEEGEEKVMDRGSRTGVGTTSTSTSTVDKNGFDDVHQHAVVVDNMQQQQQQHSAADHSQRRHDDVLLMTLERSTNNTSYAPISSGHPIVAPSTATLSPTSTYPTFIMVPPPSSRPTTASLSPSAIPLRDPSNLPSQIPSADLISGSPTLFPSSVPSEVASQMIPSTATNDHPSAYPSKSPIILRNPSSKPSLSRQPIINPSKSPTLLPSKFPTARPTSAIVNTAIANCDILYVSSAMDEDAILLFIEKTMTFLYDRFLLTVPPMKITDVEFLSQELRLQDAKLARARRELESSINRVSFTVSAFQAPPLDDDFDERLANIINAQGSFLVASLKNEDAYFYNVDSIQALDPPKDNDYIHQAQSEPSGDSTLTIVAVVGGVLCFIVMGAIIVRSIKLNRDKKYRQRRQQEHQSREIHAINQQRTRKLSHPAKKTSKQVRAHKLHDLSAVPANNQNGPSRRSNKAKPSLNVKYIDEDTGFEVIQSAASSKSYGIKRGAVRRDENKAVAHQRNTRTRNSGPIEV